MRILLRLQCPASLSPDETRVRPFDGLPFQKVASDVTGSKLMSGNVTSTSDTERHGSTADKTISTG